MPYDLSCTNPPLVQVNTVTVPNQSGSSILKLMSQMHDLEEEGLCHCKRIRKHKCEGFIEVLVAKSTSVKLSEISTLQATYAACPSCSFVSTCDVPAIAPSSRSQTDTWSAIWPCVYKVPSFEPLIFSQQEIEFVKAILSNLDEDSALIFNSKDSSSSFGRSSIHQLGHCIMEAIHAYKSSETQYYCSDCWIIALKEPCIMCGMALVHSRVSRVYFVYNSERGAYSKFNLHLKPVNYMYRVIRVIYDDNPTS